MAYQINLKPQGGLGLSDPVAERTCRHCDAAIKLVRAIMDSTTGRDVFMFECTDCGQRTWDH